jgi:dihydrofolate reductase
LRPSRKRRDGGGSNPYHLDGDCLVAPAPRNDSGPLTAARAIEGYAIVSEDGMLADANRVMPASLQFKADQQFFEHGLDGVDVVVHGRHSHEHQPRSHLRRRLILTRRVPTMSPHPSLPHALLWNPLGASLETALDALGDPVRRIAVIGGTDVFGLFLDRFDVFHLTRTPNVWLPGGRPVFPNVPCQTPEAVLAEHGLAPDQRRILDAASNVVLVSWGRPAN